MNRPRIIYQSPTGRVCLLKRGNVFSVDIAGAEYGPFTWADALAWYRRHGGRKNARA